MLLATSFGKAITTISYLAKNIITQSHIINMQDNKHKHFCQHIPVTSTNRRRNAVAYDQNLSPTQPPEIGLTPHPLALSLDTDNSPNYKEKTTQSCSTPPLF